MTTDVRVMRAEQWDMLFDRLERAFGGPAEPPESRAQWRKVSEPERMLAAWDGDEMIGTAGAFSFQVTVPGGAQLAAPGVTLVSVQPTHRRRGVLTAMMRRQLDDFHGRGEPFAVLTASEPAIYGRFGYGVASHGLTGTVDTTRTALHVPEGGERVRFRLVCPADAMKTCEEIYARQVPGRPGMLARRPGWETQPLVDPASERAGAGPLLCVLAEVDGEVRGYARYATVAAWSPAGPDGTVTVRDVEALDPVTYAALWRYLAEIDLTSKVAFRNRPTDDPLLHLVSDIRRCALVPRDGLHLRVLDVGAALAGRTYASPVDVVLDVEDAFCPWNAGRWRLTGDAKGASCERTSDAADLAVPVQQLGAAYLGGFGLRAMAGAGLVRELRPGAVAEASAAFRSDLAPWLPHGF
jgi:predicted acetyltransferase